MPSRSLKMNCTAALLASALPLLAAESGATVTSTWPREYSVQRDDATGRLTLSTPYYTVQHDLKRGGAIAVIRITHGRATNLLVQPVATRIQNEEGAVFTDLKDSNPRVSLRKDGLTEVVTVECRLLDDKQRAAGIEAKTVFEYHWGYIKIRKELTGTVSPFRAREVCPLAVVLSPTLSDYGYRAGETEPEGAAPFAMGSNRWGKLGRQTASDPFVSTPFMPRSMLFADAGIEGLEWFAGSDLSQWDLQLTPRRGEGLCLLKANPDSPGFALSISPLFRTNAALALPTRCAFNFYLGIPLIEGHALRPWLHTTFNRNRGNWVAPGQIRAWAAEGIQTVHCHNDGDYYDDGLFWRDGSYPPYPDMDKYNKVIGDCHEAGLRVATYFSNKELHPSTPEFQAHGTEWGRMNRAGKLQHNFFRGTNEFGAQMCLRSGWLDYLKLSIDRALKNHPLDGVYYDWNTALYCCNGRHEGKMAGEAALGHWDIDELLDLMEWTRRRVGPGGLVIVHDTTTPMFATENFADCVVANEWGYGKWEAEGPALDALPLEWSLVGTRARGVISYGQLNAQSPKRLHRMFALQALVSGVTPWPALPEVSEAVSILKPAGDLTTYRFADWRNKAVTLEDRRCASAIYSRPGESYVLLANLHKDQLDTQCVVHAGKLPYPLSKPTAATLTGSGRNAVKQPLNAGQLISEGVTIHIPADDAVLLHIQ